MDFITLPSKIKYTDTEALNTAVVTVEPLRAGYGNTLGNALRRVLLSSMPGCAVTAIKIKGVEHEFSAVEKVKEDVIQIILNFKKLRLNILSDEDEIRLKLHVKGVKAATAGDIEANADVEIINKDLVLCNLTNKDSEIEIDIFASKGIGYDPTENRDKDKGEVGVIAIDSIYTPVRNVGYQVEDVRVGGTTNFDKLILTIETDGTIDCREAVRRGSEILVKHFELINGEDIDNESLAAEGITEETS